MSPIREWMQRAEVRFKDSEEKMQTLIGQLDNYAKEQAAWKEDMGTAVRVEIGKVSGSLGELYSNVQTHIQMFEERIRKSEQDHRRDRHRQGLLHVKDMKPSVLEKDDQWRRWKSDVEDYAEETFMGMKDIMDRVKDSEAMIEEFWFDGVHADWWNKGEALWRFLKRYAGGEARRVVLGVSEDNGWEAWRRLHQQFEPASVTREAMVLAKYTSMVNKKAKTPKETKALMIELSERAKRVEQVTGTPVESRHAMSVIAGMLDPETSKHTAQYQGAKSNVEVLKRKVMEFTNLVIAHDSNKMDLDRVQEWADESEDLWEQEGEEQLKAFGEKCHTCGGFGHYARECPSKPKGKGKGKDGKGKGSTKGSGKGKGPQSPQLGSKGMGKATGPQFGACWTCGGSHFARDCPKTAAANTKGAGKGEVKNLCTLSERRQRAEPVPRSHSVAVQNRFKALATEERHGEDETEDPVDEKCAVGGPPREDRSGAWTRVGTTRRRWGGRSCRPFSLGTLVEVNKEGVRSVGEQEWEEIEMNVDSGATETVVGEDMLQDIETKEGSAFKRGVQYEVANGVLIPNLGEKRFTGISEKGTARNVLAQVCEVNKALLSVHKAVKAGNRVVFDPEGSYIEEIATGERLQLKEQGGMYTLKLWVQRGFQGQAN